MAGWPVFPADNHWNQRVDRLPVHPNSDAIVRSIGTGFTASRTRRAFIYPARHFASNLTDPDLPAMGERLRLKRSFDISRCPRQSRVVLRALRRYGLILADNGSSRYLSGAPHRGWDNDDLHSLHAVPGSAFDVVDTSRLPRP